MAIIKRCVICEEKLIRNRCPLCGLDHTRMMKMQYRLNTSRPYTTYQDNMQQRNSQHRTSRQRTSQQRTSTKRTASGTTNVQRNPAQRVASGRMSTTSADLKKKISDASYNRARTIKSEKQKNGGSSIIPVIIAIIVAAIGVFSEYMEDTSSYESVMAPEYIATEDVVEYDHTYGLYENAVYELSDTGELFSTTLTSGEYIVGVHLPEGYYYISIEDGWGYLDIIDPTNAVSDWYSFDSESGYSTDITELHNYPLYQGARVKISQSASLKFITYSGQTQMMNNIENPILSETDITLEPGRYYQVGTDIAAGVYDFSILDGDGYLRCGTASESGSNTISAADREIWLDADDGIPSYKNIVLNEGMLVYLDEYSEGTAVLTPSEVVDINGYDVYYDLYW